MKRLGKFYNGVMGFLAAAFVVIGFGGSGYIMGKQAGFHDGWDSACATFGPRDQPNLCSVSLGYAEREQSKPKR